MQVGFLYAAMGSPRVFTFPVHGGGCYMPVLPTHFTHMSTVLRRETETERFSLSNQLMLLSGLARLKSTGRPAGCRSRQEFLHALKSKGWKLKYRLRAEFLLWETSVFALKAFN